MRSKLKNVESGKTVDKTFNADVKVEVANVDKRTMQYLYNDGTSYVFMDTGTYDQIEITPEIVGDAAQLPAGEPGGDRRHQRGPGPLHRAAGLGRARGHLHRAGSPGRPLHRRHQAGHRRDRRDRRGAAVHHHRREDQGRHPRLLLPRSRRSLCRLAPRPASARSTCSSPPSCAASRRPRRWTARSTRARGRPTPTPPSWSAGSSSTSRGSTSCSRRTPRAGSLERMPAVDRNVLRLGRLRAALRRRRPRRGRGQRGDGAGPRPVHRRVTPVRQRRARARCMRATRTAMTQNAEQQVDLVVVGPGRAVSRSPAGPRRAGLDVLVVDKHLVGGECPYYGCIPTKMMVRAARTCWPRPVGSTGTGGGGHHDPSWAPVARADRRAGHRPLGRPDRRRPAARRRRDRRPRHRSAGRHRPGGRRRPRTALARRTSRRGGVVLNPGTRPAVPPVDGLDGTPYWTNRDAVQVTELPGSLVVHRRRPDRLRARPGRSPGSGSGSPSSSTAPRLLPADEPEAAELLGEVFSREGIRVLTGTEVTRASLRRRAPSPWRPTAGEQLVADKLLVAAGRTPNLDGPRPGDRRARPDGAHPRGRRPDARR